MGASQAWLFVRGAESVRIVVQDRAVAVHGPGDRFTESRFQEAMDAALHQAALERDLVHDGWTLERFTTERRSGADRRRAPRPGATDRRQTLLRLVRSQPRRTDPAA